MEDRQSITATFEYLEIPDNNSQARPVDDYVPDREFDIDISTK